MDLVHRPKVRSTPLPHGDIIDSAMQMQNVMMVASETWQGKDVCNPALKPAAEAASTMVGYCQRPRASYR